MTTEEKIERIHKEGIAEYKSLWVTACASAAEAIVAAGLRTEEYEFLGVIMAKRLCQWFTTGNAGRTA